MKEAAVDTELERDLREEDEDRRRAEQDRRDRETEQADSEPRVLKTPRERVEAYIESAADCLRPINAVTGGTAARDVAAALRWLDQARGVLRSPQVVDGAALLRGTLEEARDAATEGDDRRVLDRLDDAIDLLRRQVRYPDVEIPTDDFEAPSAGKRAAVRAALARHEYELRGGTVSDGVVVELIAAVEAAF